MSWALAVFELALRRVR